MTSFQDETKRIQTPDTLHLYRPVVEIHSPRSRIISVIQTSAPHGSARGLLEKGSQRFSVIQVEPGDEVGANKTFFFFFFKCLEDVLSSKVFFL